MLNFVEEVGAKRPLEVAFDSLSVGEVGYVVTGLKDPGAVHVRAVADRQR